MKFVDALEDLPSASDLGSRSGLEFMRAILAGELAAPPIARNLGFQLTDVEDGSATFEGTPEFGALNPMRGVHGGWYGTILDSAMACAVMTKVPQGSIYTTLEYKVNITRAIPVGTPVRTIGSVDHAGRTTSVASGEIRGIEDNRLYATGTTTCLIMKAPNAG